MDDSNAEVFRALADPVRRQVLDLLLERGGRTVGDLAAEFDSEMSRFGVMKHLRVLLDADLIASRRDGRSTRHYLNPVPIRLLQHRWLDKFAEGISDSLINFKNELENTVTNPPITNELATQVYQIFIKATPEQVWAALTDPEVSKKYFHEARIAVSPDRMISRGPDGSVWGDSAVEVFDPPRKLVYGWDSLYDPEMAAEPQSRVTFEIEPAGDGLCRLVVTHDRLDESPITAKSVSGPGWMFVLSNLKSYLETGEALPAAS
jgi:uncharacterized protein YndB with AHSA1/START domain/DNA-binding transcriptional ArsR family regulator